MKPAKLILALTLITLADSAMAGEASSLLRFGAEYLEQHGVALSGVRSMPVDNMSRKGLVELRTFEQQNIMGDQNFDDIVRKGFVYSNDRSTSGVVNTISSKEDGTITRTAFKYPKSSLPPESIEVGALSGPHGTESILLRREFSTLIGSFKTREVFMVAELNGKPIRRTLATQTYGKDAFAAAEIPPTAANEMPIKDVRSLNIRITVAANAEKNIVEKTTVTLPERIKGDILHFRMNPDGSKLTIITSEGQEVEYALAVDSKNHTITVVGEPNIRDLPGGIADLAAEVKIIKGRNAASKGSVRGLEVESAETQTGAAAAR